MRLLEPEEQDDSARRWLGFAVRARCAPGLGRRKRAALAERFAGEALEPSGLCCGGGLFGPGACRDELEVVVTRCGWYGTCTEDDRRVVEEWLAGQPALVEHHVGPLAAVVGEGRDWDEDPPRTRLREDDVRERALRLLRAAIRSYRRAAEVLGRPEAYEAIDDYVRASRLAESALALVARALWRGCGASGTAFLPGRDSSVVGALFHYAFDAERELGGPSPGAGEGRGATYLRITEALMRIQRMDPQETHIGIPDMHEAEHALVVDGRLLIEELTEVARAPGRSPLGRRMRREILRDEVEDRAASAARRRKRRAEEDGRDR